MKEGGVWDPQTRQVVTVGGDVGALEGYVSKEQIGEGRNF